ncbi:hypothetical protein [Oscillibacter sp.]|uniref:hypothetical protein n=1 Tax=Oscillibacter sp. TaxID=1945593 RepID=UPI002897FCD8|nr:hypothetical protein [Oscillibacter sp.]
MGKLIRLFMVEDNLDRLKTMEISSMTIYARAILNDFIQRDDANRPDGQIMSKLCS